MRGIRKMRALALGVAAISLRPMLAPAPADARPVRAYRDRPEPADAKPSRMPDGPINIVISIGSQRLWVYDKRGLLETSIVSTGVGGYPTPTGRVPPSSTRRCSTTPTSMAAPRCRSCSA